MTTEIALYQFDAAPMAVEKKRGNYEISVYGGTPFVLQRNTDFGVIRKKNGDLLTKHPTLFKSGAEKVAVAYGLCQRHHIESKIEDIENGFFYFLDRCDLVKIVNGQEYIITCAYGSANTREGRTGTQSPYDGANSAVKMAQKRALVSAALSLGCMSDCFTNDIESDLEDASAYFKNKDPESTIDQYHVRFFYNVASKNGITNQQARAILKSHGYEYANKIKTKDFDMLIEELRKENTDCL